MTNPGCKGCTERYVTEHSNCHATCKDYLDASKQRREELDRIKKIKDTDRAVTEVTKDYVRTNRFCK